MDMTELLSYFPYKNTKPNNLKLISYTEQDQMIIDQFHRHRRQCSIAAVPLGPTTPVGFCCGPTFVSEPDWFCCHGSDLLERILQIFVCWQKRFTFWNHSRAKIGEMAWRYFQRVSAMVTTRRGLRLILSARRVWPPSFWRHRSRDLTPTAGRLAAQQIRNSQPENYKLTDLRTYKGWQGGIV